jgi:cell filamentation protein
LYGAAPDPYVYAGTDVLKNRLGIRDADVLEQFEAACLLERGAEPLPDGRFGAAHYRAVHRHLFGDVYRWAGRYRTVRLAKQGSVFCYPENIPGQMDRLFRQLRQDELLRGLSKPAFAEASATFLATLNAIHPFREGNGRSQMAFMSMLASRAEYPLSIEKLEPASFLDAMVRSFAGDEGPLATQLLRLIE